MSSKQISPLLRTWYKWKALRLPWRKRFLVGLDLQGNTYWEFRDVRGDPRPGEPVRWRRIVQYPRDTHYGEVKVSPQWHQWLRNMRERPPTLQEQHHEARRQAQMKYLAAEADARWEAKPRVMDAPAGEQQQQQQQQPVAALESRTAQTAPDGRKEDPWKKHRRAGPSEDWQPQGWTPPASKR
ncbi:hypothetical protein M406DRAFT_354322 [Cryphonectria parasitica EP155]|uniref:NADH dehydrogenase [ubiquinone] 1 alpha subcomplex subunit n=1 Tax=Cryphonectria parasitica (strain ATCC 38755 / EP155) TaxID=660469 RepID=A0A9P4YAZ5_CRYP1|nr:uncharacterized protein M406DRAFT_354322 [Cryphonectria parasitica EP155]KAF3770197.1 hypothetical protein M406DRAFT_354322 [Cryphonectria parasitica EP155]